MTASGTEGYIISDLLSALKGEAFSCKASNASPDVPLKKIRWLREMPVHDVKRKYNAQSNHMLYE